MLQGDKTRISALPIQRSEKGEDDDLREAVRAMQEDISKLDSPALPNNFRQGFKLGSNQSGNPMNDAQLRQTTKDDNELGAYNIESNIRELRKRVSVLEDLVAVERQPDTWDVPMKPIPPNATLGEVIKAVNILIQRNQRLKKVK